MAGAQQTRLARLREIMHQRRLAAFISRAAATHTHLSGFRALLYSRPITLLVDAQRTTLIVPALEEEHARHDASVDELLVYSEHPGADRPSSDRDVLEEALRKLPSGASIGLEAETVPHALVALISEAGFHPVDIEADVARLRVRKDSDEVSQITGAARLVESGVANSLQAVAAGKTELEVDAAGTATVLARAAELEGYPAIEQLVMTPSGSERSTLPHAFSTTRRLESGDVLIHTRQVALNGYRAELERTVFVGTPSTEQRRLFDVMRRAQDVAIAAARAGVRCCDIDGAARSVIAEAGLDRYAIHRSGHGIGLMPHERPYLRFDNIDVLEDGMVVTIEPGFYVPGMGGFRHSDTLLVTHLGCEVLTSFPKDLESVSFG